MTEVAWHRPWWRVRSPRWRVRNIDAVRGGLWWIKFTNLSKYIYCNWFLNDIWPVHDGIFFFQEHRCYYCTRQVGVIGSDVPWLECPASNDVAGCLIRGRRRWSVTYTSPLGLRSSEFRIWNRRAIQERKPYQFPGWMKYSPYYIAPAGGRTHDLPHTQTS